MKDLTKFYINGEWVAPGQSRQMEVINPATEQPVAKISLAGPEDVNKAVAAAKAAFIEYSQTTREQRIALLQKLEDVYNARFSEMGDAITLEMGAPESLAQTAQTGSGLAHITTCKEVLKTFEFEKDHGTFRVFLEPIGVCGLITPWNWPINEILCKVAPALAAGCTMVLKPSELSPISAYLFAEMFDAAGYPKGVFNLVNGTGPEAGQWLCTHPDVDMLSLTGSTASGVKVSKYGAETIKRVALELGGKSANIILDDADFNTAVTTGVMHCFHNSGQSCNAPTRMLVPASRYDEAVAIAKAAAEKVMVAPPAGPGKAAGPKASSGEPSSELKLVGDDDEAIGPQANKKQWLSTQNLIQTGINEGCRLVCGGVGRPEGFDVGYYTKPTIFADVKNSHIIAQTEIFGPVLVMIKYTDDDDAVAIANDSPYGLSGYVSGGIERARRVASRIRAGNVHINDAPLDMMSPFGGYKQSGNGREWGVRGIQEYMETKSVLGYAPPEK